MKRNVPIWLSVLIAVTVVILIGKSYLILARPSPPGMLGLRLIELAGRNAAMLAASLLAFITQRRPFFQVLCVMGLVRETWDFGNMLHFSGFGPDSIGLAAFSGLWGFALWTLTRPEPDQRPST